MAFDYLLFAITSLIVSYNLFLSLAPMIIVHFILANYKTVCLPIPVFPPVITATFSLRSLCNLHRALPKYFLAPYKHKSTPNEIDINIGVILKFPIYQSVFCIINNLIEENKVTTQI